MKTSHLQWELNQKPMLKTEMKMTTSMRESQLTIDEEKQATDDSYLLQMVVKVVPEKFQLRLSQAKIVKGELVYL